MVLKIGLVGFGLNALGWSVELRINPLLRGKTEIAGVFDPSPEGRERITKARLHPVEDFEALRNISGLQALFINSPPQFHAQQSQIALESGLHVYSEVPMALTKLEIEKLIATQDTHPKVKYQLGENYCFLSEVLYAGHLVSSGKIGKAVYAESEYLHDVTYRWRQGKKGDSNTPRVESWYSKFDPLAYAHSIGPAQVALGGIDHPMAFTEVQSYGNFNGGVEDKPECLPSFSFHVALFKSETNAIAKCANAYVFAREPSRLIIQVTGRTGTYECYKIGGKGRLFSAENHLIKFGHRVGKVSRVGQHAISKVIPRSVGGHYGANARTVRNWLDAINSDKDPAINTKVAGNFCLSGIAASESARNGKAVAIIDYNTKK